MKLNLIIDETTPVKREAKTYIHVSVMKELENIVYVLAHRSDEMEKERKEIRQHLQKLKLIEFYRVIDAFLFEENRVGHWYHLDMKHHQVRVSFTIKDKARGYESVVVPEIFGWSKRNKTIGSHTKVIKILD